MSRSSSTQRGRTSRPYLLVLLGIVILLAMMAVGPLQSLLAATDRVAALRESRDRLRTEVAQLEARRDRIDDPRADREEIELLARSELGLVRPGEKPFIVVTPEAQPRIDRSRPDATPATRSWYTRLREALRELVR